MRTHLALAVACLASVACSEATPVDGCRPALVSPFVSPDSVAVAAGSDAKLQLVLPPLTCLPADRALVSGLFRLQSPIATVPSTRARVEADALRTLVTVPLDGIEPGLWNATVFIEPAIAVVSTLVVIGHDQRDRAPFAVGRQPCPGRGAFTNRGTRLCEQPADQISVTGVDGVERASFQGRRLEIRENVVWSVRSLPNNTGAVLERRVDSATGLLLTHELIPPPRPPAPDTGAPLWADEGWFWSGTWLVQALDDGLHVDTITPATDSNGLRLRFVDRSRALELRRGTVCDVSGRECWAQPLPDANHLIFVSPTRVWFDEYRDAKAPFRSFLRPFEGAELRESQALPAAPGMEGFEPRSGIEGEGFFTQRLDERTLVEREDGAFDVWRFPADVRLRQVTRRLLVVTNPAGGVDLYRR